MAVLKGPEGLHTGDIDIEGDVDRHFDCSTGASKSVQVLICGIETVTVLTLRIPKWRALTIEKTVCDILLGLMLRSTGSLLGNSI